MAAGEGNLAKVQELLRENPDMNINLGDDYDGTTALHQASHEPTPSREGVVAPSWH